LPSSAHAADGRGEVAATRAYLLASLEVQVEEHAGLNQMLAAAEGRASEIARECPGALTYAPRDEAFEQLLYEAQSVIAYAAAVPARDALLRLSDAIVNLRWHERRLTALVHVRVVEERAVATLALPNLCTDLASWRGSAYSALPASATSFLASVEAIEAAGAGEPGEGPREMVIMRLLRPHETPALRRLAKRVAGMERQTNSRLEAAAATARKRLTAALGVPGL
jgi:hypothetical protein